jgi:hypothetical protein
MEAAVFGTEKEETEEEAAKDLVSHTNTPLPPILRKC